MLFLRVWEGLSSFGGFIACAFLTWWFFRKEKLPFWPYADNVAYGLSLGWFLGRMGCFVAHDHPGNYSSFWLAVPGMCPTDTGRADPLVACHDMGFYEGLFSLALLGFFLFMDRKPRFQGFYVAWMATLYAPVRFLMDFLRHPDVDARYAGLTPAQYGSVIMGVVGVYLILKQKNTPPVRSLLPPPEAPAPVAEPTPSP
jgi:phosphatidylglycerol:prolipoprotein diacylglycerol transferase